MKSVNSYTEWGQLEEVVLGSHYNTQVSQLDLSMQMLYHDNLKRAGRLDPSRTYTINKQYIEEREEDIAALTKILESFHVIVKRPEIINEVQTFNTPYWQAMTKACDNPRDQVMIVGDMIIETACCVRNRYFENDLLKPILYKYFKAGAKWICAPRPKLEDASFDRSYVDDTRTEEVDAYEMMFDAAQCLRFGKDILFNVRTWNHELGFRWLAQVLGEKFRLHKVAVVDNHLDGGILPLRPGKLLVSPKISDRLHTLPESLQKWDRLNMEDISEGNYSEDDLLLSSDRIDVNLLSIDQTHVLINEYATKTIRILEKHGFTPVLVRFRHSRIFGGGLHCVSLDIRRNEQLEDYFS